MPKVVYLKKSTNPNKKYMVYVDPPGRTIHFGAAGMSDYTKHKDKERMARYNARHKSSENWGASGITTAGFWSKWLLWNKPSLSASKASMSKRFGITFKSGWGGKSRSRSRSRRKSRKRSRSRSR